VSLCHQVYLPALAYVVSGKTQRRHLLLGELGSAAPKRLGCVKRFQGSIAAGTGGVMLHAGSSSVLLIVAQHLPMGACKSICCVGFVGGAMLASVHPLGLL
jgi:hypothetical protein